MRTQEFSRGLRDGLPICLGYISVSVAYGMTAVLAGVPLWAAVLISLTNLTSAGQFAGTNLMVARGGMAELGLTTLVINIRYFLMSLSVSQKVEEKMSLGRRLAVAFGITDEIFAVSMQHPGELTAPYMAGLILTPVLGWTGGTLVGGAATSVMPEALSSALGIALYGSDHSAGQGGEECAVYSDTGGSGQPGFHVSPGTFRTWERMVDHYHHSSGERCGGLAVSKKRGRGGKDRMSTGYLLTGIAVMAAITYLVRVLPMAIFRKRIRSRFVQSFLYYVPYAVLSAMTFPAIFGSTGSKLGAAAGCAAALVLAYFRKGLLMVAVGAAVFWCRRRGCR